jgi:hypothetical protein
MGWFFCESSPLPINILVLCEIEWILNEHWMNIDNFQCLSVYFVSLIAKNNNNRFVDFILISYTNKILLNPHLKRKKHPICKSSNRTSVIVQIKSISSNNESISSNNKSISICICLHHGFTMMIIVIMIIIIIIICTLELSHTVLKRRNARWSVFKSFYVSIFFKFMFKFLYKIINKSIIKIFST